MRGVLQLLYKPAWSITWRSASFSTKPLSVQVTLFGRATLSSQNTLRTSSWSSSMPLQKRNSARSFFWNVFRWFVSNFARLAALHNKKMGKDQPEHFGSLNVKESAAVVSVEGALISPSVLFLLKNKGLYILYTYSCDKQIKCVLYQEQ